MWKSNVLGWVSTESPVLAYEGSWAIVAASWLAATGGEVPGFLSEFLDEDRSHAFQIPHVSDFGEHEDLYEVVAEGCVRAVVKKGIEDEDYRVRSEDFAQTLLDEQQFSHEECLKLLGQLSIHGDVSGVAGDSFPTQSLTVGQFVHGDMPGVTNETRWRPNLSTYLVAYVKHHCPEAACSTITVGRNLPGALKQDQTKVHSSTVYLCAWDHTLAERIHRSAHQGQW